MTFDPCTFEVTDTNRAHLIDAQLNPGLNVVLIGRQILIGRFFFKFVNETNGFF